MVTYKEDNEMHPHLKSAIISVLRKLGYTNVEEDAAGNIYYTAGDKTFSIGEMEVGKEV